MNIKQLALSAALVGALSPAFAIDQTIDLSTGVGSFTSGTTNVLQGGDDVITFANLANGLYEFTLTLSGQNIAWNSVSLNGNPMTVLAFNNNKISLGYLEGTGHTPFVLDLFGAAASKAVYSGELTVTAVPEPGTYALLLAGLGVVGFVARRRKG